MKDCLWIVALDAFEAPDEWIRAGADAFVVGLEGYSSRIRANASLDALRNLISMVHEQGAQLFVNMQAMVEETHVETSRQAFFDVLESGADGIYAADDAYLQFAIKYDQACPDRKASALSRLIIQPETLINSFEDVQFFENLGVQAVSLSHELTAAEIIACAQGNPDVEILISGRYSWMESRRPLIENYLREIEQSDRFASNRIYTLVEQSRQNAMPAWQDHLGTHVLSDTSMEAGCEIAGFYQAGIRRFRIDALLDGNRKAMQRLKAYRAFLDVYKQEEKREEILKLQANEHIQNLEEKTSEQERLLVSPLLEQAAGGLPKSTLPQSEMSIRKEKARV